MPVTPGRSTSLSHYCDVDVALQALDFVAFQRSLRTSWWQLLTATLVLLQDLGSKQASAANVTILLADAAQVIETDVSPAALDAMPTPMDLEVGRPLLLLLRSLLLRLPLLRWHARRCDCIESPLVPRKELRVMAPSIGRHS